MGQGPRAETWQSHDWQLGHIHCTGLSGPGGRRDTGHLQPDSDGGGLCVHAGQRPRAAAADQPRGTSAGGLSQHIPLQVALGLPPELMQTFLRLNTPSFEPTQTRGGLAGGHRSVPALPPTGQVVTGHLLRRPLYFLRLGLCERHLGSSLCSDRAMWMQVQIPHPFHASYAIWGT